jgi:hypothetical protein
MVSNNNLTLAVAGSRKTQSIIDECVAAEPSARILIVTYTTVNQAELRARLAAQAGDHPNVEVMGWFAFLLAHFVRPFVPFSFRGARVRGFDNESHPQQGVGVTEYRRYFNPDGQVRRVHLPQLACKIEADSGGQAVRRLEELYDHVFVDEVQDLCGYDLEILKLLMASSVPLSMVGDVRQATLATNGREAKNKQFMHMGIWQWFRSEEKAGRLAIAQRNETYRCGPDIAAFADTLFGPLWGFEKTVSLNEVVTDHDGIFAVRTEDVAAYDRAFAPLALRVMKSVGVGLPLAFMNFGEVKGMGRPRILILPTEPIRKFLKTGAALTDAQASAFYVAVTRAEQSVAFILDDPSKFPLPVWDPGPPMSI